MKRDENWYWIEEEHPWITTDDDGFIAWLKRCYVCGVIDEFSYTQAYGQHEGYPACCIANFLFLEELNLPAYKTMSLIYGEDDPNIQYVRCPKCREESENEKTV